MLYDYWCYSCEKTFTLSTRGLQECPDCHDGFFMEMPEEFGPDSRFTSRALVAICFPNCPCVWSSIFYVIPIGFRIITKMQIIPHQLQLSFQAGKAIHLGTALYLDSLV